MGYVVSLSGGKDSTAMLLMMLEKGEQVDEAVMFDGGWEFPEMEAHIEKLRKTVGVPITIVHAPHSFEYYMFEYELTKGKHKGQVGLGFPRPFARWCTMRKTQALDKYASEHLNGRTQCIGIAADENRPTKPKFRYPLIEWGVTEKEALEYCLKRGFDWGGLYKYMNRVSCWCCPLQSLQSSRSLRKTHPELWAKLLDMEKRMMNSTNHGTNNVTFRIDYTAKQLEERFSQEDRQMTLELFGLI